MLRHFAWDRALDILRRRFDAWAEQCARLETLPFDAVQTRWPER